MTPSIIECLDNKRLFATHFQGGTWGPWRAVLKALFALEMDDTELALYQACTGRKRRQGEGWRWRLYWRSSSSG
jgi:hypothetical protein